MTLRLEARQRTPAWMNLALPVAAIVAALVLCSGLIALAGAGVFEAYGVMFSAAFGDSYAITETLVRAAPMIFTGLAVAVAFRAKFWNIGAEGQLLAGAVASCAVGAIPMPGPLAMLLMALAGAAARKLRMRVMTSCRAARNLGSSRVAIWSRFLPRSTVIS